ncbi:unnamed protein product [Medioppia subpectinata]|uniref:Uncharacterized protein n=2 Tax=Medioppia subpectinata TaxID=1979941 RepID=A0A7R9KMM1_9ACAR|nr:unnamed protein product [Medioppia subpectinata]CAG2106060.1 unnamed protein product [Medioppia subpectinata]
MTASLNVFDSLYETFNGVIQSVMSKLLQSRKTLKEKVVQIYEALIEGKEPFSENNNFWNEFFLLKANGNALELELKSITNIHTIKPIVNLMISQSIIAVKSDNNLRVANSLIVRIGSQSAAKCTLSSLFKVMSEKWRLSHPKFDLIDYTVGREDLELKTQVSCQLPFDFDRLVV